MKQLLASIRLALTALVRNKVRSALTALGILIGIAAVVVVTALSVGARERIGGQIESLGSNLLFIWNKPAVKSGARVVSMSGLTDRDAAAIRRESSAIKAVSVYSDVKMQVVSQYNNDRIGVMGVDRYYFGVRGYQVKDGRQWTESEEAIKAKVCVIGQTAIQKLFGNDDPIGSYLRVGRHPFRIIGTLEPKGQSPFEDQDDRILMPIGSWRARVRPTHGDRVQLIMASAKSAAQTDRAQKQIDEILQQRHRIDLAGGDERDYQIRTQAAFKEKQDQIYDILTVLLVGVAAVALFAGGVGVMNIMLVSVTERTREIGIRMAIGAQKSDIQRQFLIEAIALTVFGGVLGIGLAVGLIRLMSQAFGWAMALPMEAVAVAMGTSIVVGIVFGFLPAQRAAALDPIEALRHE